MEKIYFIKRNNSNEIKIGWTIREKISERILELQTGNAQELILIGFINVNDGQGCNYEKFLHKKFKNYQCKCGGTEWFDDRDNVIEEYIVNIMKNLDIKCINGFQIITESDYKNLHPEAGESFLKKIRLYPEQDNAACELFENILKGYRLQCFYGDMQGGKTGGILGTISKIGFYHCNRNKQLIKEGKSPKRILILYLLSDSKLSVIMQNTGRANSCFLTSNFDDNIIIEFCHKGSASLKEIKGKKFDIVYVFDDECQIAKNKGLVDSLLRNNFGIYLDEDYDSWESGRYYIAVSATPFAHLLMEDMTTVKLETSLFYTGIECQYNRGILKPGKPLYKKNKLIDEEIDKLINIIGSTDEPAYFVPRLKGNPIILSFKKIMDNCGIKCIEFSTKAEEILKIIETLSTKPNENTILIVREGLRLGDSIEMKYVRWMHDMISTKVDTIMQSFVGRACGNNREYRPDLEILIDINKIKKFIQESKNTKEALIKKIFSPVTNNSKGFYKKNEARAFNTKQEVINAIKLVGKIPIIATCSSNKDNDYAYEAFMENRRGASEGQERYYHLDGPYIDKNLTIEEQNKRNDSWAKIVGKGLAGKFIWIVERKNEDQSPIDTSANKYLKDTSCLKRKNNEHMVSI